MIYENLNITQEEFENNTNLHINIVDISVEDLLNMCLAEKGIEITDDVSKADYTLENPSSADGFDFFTLEILSISMISMRMYLLTKIV